MTKLVVNIQTVFLVVCAFFVVQLEVFGAPNSATSTPADFHLIQAKAKGTELQVEWVIAYEDYHFLKTNGYQIAIRYLDAKQYQEANKKWHLISSIPIHKMMQVIDVGTVSSELFFQVGIYKEGQINWSKVQKTHVEKTWNWFNLIVLIGSLALFVHGLKSIGEGLQQSWGTKLRGQISSITSNQLRGIITGFSITSIVQSIIASLLMIVSFVNAGLLTLTQSAGVMLGAGVGAALTTWLINLLAFEINLTAYALFILAFSAPFLFFGKKRWKPWLNTIFGFVLLILGLGFMIANMPENLTHYPFIEKILACAKLPLVGPLLFASIGLAVSLFLQSTVATIALLMALLTSSNLPFDVAIAVFLGANLGTALNVEIASRKGNVHAKRSARLNSIFTGFGFIWAMLFFPLILKSLQWLMINMGWGDPLLHTHEVGNTGLALFHTFFAGINALILVWFIPQFIQLVQKLVKSKGRSDEVFHLEYINSGNLSTADLSILEAKKEIAKFGNLTQRMSKMVRSLLYEKNTHDFEKILERIKKYEDITDRIEIEVVQYLNKLSDGDLTLQTASRIHGMNSMVNDLERVGDIFYQMSKNIERKAEEKLWFTPEQRNNLAQMFDLIDEALAIMYANLQEHHAKVNIDGANAAEQAINEKRDELRKSYLENLSNQDANFKAGMIYNDLFSSLEKVGDHVINVSEAVVGKV